MLRRPGGGGTEDRSGVDEPNDGQGDPDSGQDQGKFILGQIKVSRQHQSNPEADGDGSRAQVTRHLLDPDWLQPLGPEDLAGRLRGEDDDMVEYRAENVPSLLDGQPGPTCSKRGARAG